MAVRRYSGGWSEARYEEHRQVLRMALEAAAIDAIGDPVWARYDSPMKPWFLRRNEVMIEIDWRGEDTMAHTDDARPRLTPGAH